MSILVNEKTKVVVQGMTGTQASFHVKRMIESGTKIVAGVSPHHGSSKYLNVPLFSSVEEAVQKTGANTSLVFVPAPHVKDAVLEALNAGLKLVVSIAYGVPILDMIEIKKMLKKHEAILIGPNTPGIVTPQEALLGVFPENIHHKGSVGIVSRSSTLTYEAVLETNKSGLGQSTVVGLGDDMITGSDFVSILSLFNKDPETKAVIMIGDIDGTYEEEAAAYYHSLKEKKPLIAYITGDDMLSFDIGYASDILTCGKVTTADKKRLLKNAGAIVVDEISQIHRVLAELK